MTFALELLAGVCIYGFAGWAMSRVNRLINLDAVPSSAARVSIRVFTSMIIFLAATAPPLYGLTAIVH